MDKQAVCMYLEECINGAILELCDEESSFVMTLLEEIIEELEEAV